LHLFDLIVKIIYQSVDFTFDLILFIGQFDLLDLFVLIVELSLISFSVFALRKCVEIRVFVSVTVFFLLFSIFSAFILIVILHFQLLSIFTLALFLATFFACCCVKFSLFLEFSVRIDLLFRNVKELVGVL